jgi:arsenate reductase (glutaredoxin)
MSRKIFYLPNCGTCKRILSELKMESDDLLRDIKDEPIKPEELDEMAKLAGSYEALFSRIAMKYRSMGLNKLSLAEKDYRKFILEEYTFLKRPTVIVGDKIFIGSSKNNIGALIASYNKR